METHAKKLFTLLFAGFLVGNAFAEPQRDPAHETPNHADSKQQPEPKDEQRGQRNDSATKNLEKNKAKFINIKVPNTADSNNKWVTNILSNRGTWVRADTVVAILNDGEKEIYVKSPDTGIVMKVPVTRGDSVSQGATLIQLKIINAQRPRFQLAWNIFSLMNVSVPSVGKRIGGRVKDNIDIPEIAHGKWTNACAARMSFVLNNTDFPIKQGKYATVSGRKGELYIYRLNEITSYLRDIFGDPDIVIDRAPRRDDFSWMKGILAVTGKGRNGASGHVTLWNGVTCADACYLTGDETNEGFTPLKAELWILP